MGAGTPRATRTSVPAVEAGKGQPLNWSSTEDAAPGDRDVGFTIRWWGTWDGTREGTPGCHHSGTTSPGTRTGRLPLAGLSLAQASHSLLFSLSLSWLGATDG